MNQKNIAIVDDEPTILNLLKSLLEKGNYRVSTFDNPVAALPRLSTGEYDMILLDIQMPQMDGLELLGKVMEVRPNQKVMMMTAYSTLDRVLKSHKLGADQYLM